MARKQPAQLELDLRQKGRHTKKGAGRPKGPDPEVWHRERESFKRYEPLHLTVRLKRGIPHLRKGRFVRAFRALLIAISTRKDFRVVHYSIQKNHLHLLVEADDKKALANGMKSLNARIARTVNRVFQRKGKVLHGRFHSTVVRSPTQARHMLAYVLLNFRHHLPNTPPDEVDRASSGVWFDGWWDHKPIKPPRPCEVARPETWYLRDGWRKARKPISIREVPG